MPAKKKQQRNAFYWFMQDIMPELRAQGHNFPGGMADVVPVALPRWKNLPADRKNYYEKRAKEEKKAAQRGASSDKSRLDNQGNVIANRVDERDELVKRKAKERRIARSRWPPRADPAIMEEKFYFVSFEYLCETEEGEVTPKEVGLIEWSMEHGITKSYHKFIDPGEIPLGYRYTCQSHSDETHQIPVTGFELADNNYMGIWIQLENFVNPSGEKKEYPPLYCPAPEMSVVERCMDWLHRHACVSYANRLQKIFHLETCVMDLYEWGGSSVLSEAAALDLLHTSAFDYEPNTRCAWHEEKEVKYCALGNVKRFAFVLSDALAAIYNFELTPAHLPVRTGDIPSCTVIPSSAVHMGSQSYSSKPRLGRGVAAPGPGPGSMGRGITIEQDSGPFPARDFRYSKPAYSASNFDDDDEGSESSRTSSSQPGNATAAPWSMPNSSNQARLPSYEMGDFPSLGAVAPKDDKPKYAGRASAPAPSELPKPVGWQGQQSQRLPQSKPLAASVGGSTYSAAPAWQPPVQTNNTDDDFLFGSRPVKKKTLAEAVAEREREEMAGVGNTKESKQKMTIPQQQQQQQQQFQAAPAPQANPWFKGATPGGAAPGGVPSSSPLTQGAPAWGRGAQRAPGVASQPGPPAIQPAYGRGRGIWNPQPVGVSPDFAPPGISNSVPGYGRGVSIQMSGLSLDNQPK